jgi:succinate dehydrogenase hydrophobic anchor subunit
MSIFLLSLQILMIVYVACFIYGVFWGVKNKDKLFEKKEKPDTAIQVVVYFFCGVVGPYCVVVSLKEGVLLKPEDDDAENAE